MNGPLQPPQTIERILTVLTQGAGREIATTRAWREISGDIGFFITDSEGTHFTGTAPAEWLALTVPQVMDKFIEKYPLAFAPKSPPTQIATPMTPTQQREAIKVDLIGKFQREDWHGVMDCAADLREHDAYQRGIQRGLHP